MKLISLNIELNKHYNTVLNFLKNEKPDVICLQEVLEKDFEFFKKELEMEGVFKERLILSDHPYYAGIEGKREGAAIFAKEIVSSNYLYFKGNENTLIKGHEENAVLVWVEVKDENNQLYKFITTQLPVTEKASTTPEQLKTVASFLKELSKLEEFILCGDMNAPRGKEAFNNLAEKYKDNIPPEYKTSLDQNLHRVKGLQNMVDGLFTTPRYEASNVK